MPTNQPSQETIITQLHENYRNIWDKKEKVQPLLANLTSVNAHDFQLPTIYEELVRTFRLRKNRCERASPENWRFKPQRKYSLRNKGEKLLEKQVVNLDPKDKRWANQIPVASGVFASDKNQHCAVDLAYEKRAGVYELFELKTEIGTNNPVYAAYEILLYGIVYAFYRNHAITQHKDNNAKPLLSANSITLVVAAPDYYYERYENLSTFEKCLARQLSEWASVTLTDVRMTFRFDSFYYCNPEVTPNENAISFRDNRSHIRQP